MRYLRVIILLLLIHNTSAYSQLFKQKRKACRFKLVELYCSHMLNDEVNDTLELLVNDKRRVFHEVEPNVSYVFKGKGWKYIQIDESITIELKIYGNFGVISIGKKEIECAKKPTGVIREYFEKDGAKYFLEYQLL